MTHRFFDTNKAVKEWRYGGTFYVTSWQSSCWFDGMDDGVSIRRAVRMSLIVDAGSSPLTEKLWNSFDGNMDNKTLKTLHRIDQSFWKTLLLIEKSEIAEHIGQRTEVAEKQRSGQFSAKQWII